MGLGRHRPRGRLTWPSLTTMVPGGYRNDWTSCHACHAPIAISTTPTHWPTVPRRSTSRIPTRIPNTVQLYERLRDTSRSISTVVDSARGGSDSRRFASAASPVSCELCDSDLDLVKGDIAQAPRRDDLQTIYHDV